MNAFLHRFVLLSALVASVSGFAQEANDNALPCLQNSSCRIVSTSSNMTKLLEAVGAERYIVGVDRYSETAGLPEGVVNIGTYPQLSPEILMALKPDLVVVWQQLTPDGLVDRLERLGLNILPINLQTVNDIPDSLRELGGYLGAEAMANQAADALEAKSAALQAQYRSQSPVTVFYEMWDQPLMTIGRDHFIHEAIVLCGGKNIFVDLNGGVTTVSLEAVIARNPDLIISRELFGEESKAPAIWSSLDTIAAVKNNHVITLSDSGLTMPTPETLAGIGRLCSHIDSVRTAAIHTFDNASHHSLESLQQ